MNKLNRSVITLFFVSIAVFQAFPTTAAADEVWVTPAVLNASKVVGNWAVTGTGYTRFGFVVPDNFTGLPEAKVVVLGQGSAPVAISYSLALSVSGDGIGQAQRTYSLAGGAVNITPNVFTEIDVSSILPTDIPLSPGDYVSLYFNTTANAASANILGLRFIYSGPGIPRGAIMMWSGSTLLSGWALCDGQNGTPDLRDRFILGAGSIYPLGQVGGEAAHTLTEAEMPSHTHTDKGHKHKVDAHTSSITTADGDHHRLVAGDRDNSVETEDGFADLQSAGGGQAHNNMPPYYALCFIMKL